jgi:hypothetical protein
MTEKIDTIVAVSMLLSGLFITLIGFNIIKLKPRKPEDEEKMAIWRKKFSNSFKIGGSLILIIGVFLAIAPILNIKSGNWSQSQKEEMKKQVINNSNFLQSLNPDTANMVVTCFVDKYTEKYSLQDSWKQDKLPQEQIIELTMPMLKECFQLYGIETNK